MIRCALCPKVFALDPFCSALAVLTLHWMTDHREAYLADRPNANLIRSILDDAA